MSDIADFLRARYAEQRALAEATAEDAGKDWSPGDEYLSSSVNDADSGAAVVIGPWEYLDWDTRRHIAAHDPAAVLADLDAKLFLIEGCEHALAAAEADPTTEAAKNATEVVDRLLRYFAASFAGHPDHKGEEWKP
ncbi:DUF6221 family protein [Streptomyces olivaceus]|uniref:DUF6221 family protein n=1 Tax=Streptomyces olivaceus TaxID=47716 RepID=UPI0033DEC9C1